GCFSLIDIATSFPGSVERDPGYGLITTGKQLAPTLSDFIIGPSLGGFDIDMHNNMQMVTHDGIAVDADGKAGGDFLMASGDRQKCRENLNSLSDEMGLVGVR
ncbi:MAG: hypothetical protein ACREO1_01030, partial [Arenimonas sp.]